MSTNYFRVRGLNVQKSEKVKEETKPEEKEETAAKVVQLKRTFTGKRVVNEEVQRNFENWLDAEYQQAFKIVVNQDEVIDDIKETAGNEDVETPNPFHYSTSLTENDVNNWEALQEAIQSMGLRETYCKGVYCQQHNPDMPAGDYTFQKHYVWNDSTKEMEELPNIYYISEDGSQARSLDGYEQILAYQQGYRFTETDGVYEKDGKNYKFNVETMEFEEIEEESENPIDAILNKYDTEEYDQDVMGIEAITVISEILNELTPVLQAEYHMSNTDIQNLVSEAIGASSKPNLSYGSTINVRTFVNTLRELITNFVPSEPEEPVDNRTDLEKFIDRIESDEFDKTVSKEEIQTYIDEFRTLLMADFSENRGYSEEYSNFMFDFIQNYMNIGEEVNLKDVLKEFYENINTLTTNYNERATLNTDLYCSVKNIYTDFVKEIINKNIQNTYSSIWNLFAKINETYGHNTYGGALFINEFKYLNSGNDNTGLDDFYNLVKIFVQNFDSYMNATQIDADNLFKGADSITAKDLYNSQLAINEDCGLMKFSQYFQNAMNRLKITFDKYDNEELFRSVIVLLNKRAGVQNTVPASLQRETIERLNQEDIFAILDEILTSDELIHEYYCGVDGYIDDFGQGGKGDCWLLGALISLNATESGRQILQDSIKVNDDGSVTVTFKGLGLSRTVTAESMVEARGYSHGDNDVLAIELAVEQLINEGLIAGNYTEGGRPENAIRYFTGLEHRSYYNLDKNTFKGIADEFNNGNCFITVDANKSWGVKKDEYEFTTMTTVDGEEFQFVKGHAYGVVAMTEDTITIVNPWYSDKEYTISLKTFNYHGLNMFVNANPQEIDIANADNFTVDGKEYNMEELLNSDEPAFSSLTPDFISDENLFPQGRIVSIIDGPHDYDYSNIRDKIDSIIKSMADSLNAGYMNNDKVEYAMLNTRWYFDDAFKQLNPAYLAELEEEGCENDFTDTSFVYETTDNESVLNGSAFEGQTSETGLYFAHNTVDNTWYVQIDIKAVLQKFLSFLQ